MKQNPTILRLSRSFRSRFCRSASTDILQSKVAPDVTSIKLSNPKPTSEMLPATSPAVTPTRPSRLFQATVKYSSRFPRWAIARRVGTNSLITLSIAGRCQDRTARLALFGSGSQTLSSNGKGRAERGPSGFPRLLLLTEHLQYSYGFRLLGRNSFEQSCSSSPPNSFMLFHFAPRRSNGSHHSNTM